MLIFAAIMGFGGAFISLAISKWTAKKSVGARVIDAPSNSAEFWRKTIGPLLGEKADASVLIPAVGEQNPEKLRTAMWGAKTHCTCT